MARPTRLGDPDTYDLWWVETWARISPLPRAENDRLAEIFGQVLLDRVEPPEKERIMRFVIDMANAQRERTAK